MRSFEVRCQLVPKSGSAQASSDDFADWCITDGELRVAVADGATNSFQPREWAEKLVVACLDGSIRPTARRRTINARLARLATQEGDDWERHDPSAWLSTLLAKRGSHAALVAVSFTKVRRRWMWSAIAAGDSTLALVDPHGALSRTFPMGLADRFGASPALVSSVPPQFGAPKTRYRMYGSFPRHSSALLSSDALSEWLFAEWASRRDPWPSLLAAMRSPESFQTWVSALRLTGVMRDDDVTALMVSRR